MLKGFWVIKELIGYIKTENVWFLLPFFLIIGLLVTLAILAETGSIILPFIYAGF